MSLDLATRIAQLEQKLDRLVMPEIPAAFSSNIACRVYNNANISVGDAAWTSLTFNTERFDTDAMHSTSVNTGRLTCVHAGVYLITGNVTFATNATGTRGISIYLNGTTYIAMLRGLAGSSSLMTHLSIATIYELAVNEYVELQVYQSSGGALNATYTANQSPEFAMARLA